MSDAPVESNRTETLTSFPIASEQKQTVCGGETVEVLIACPPVKYQGRCENLGCKTTAECTATFGSQNFVCEQVSGETYRACYQTCKAAADCVAPNAPSLFDADNYACDQGRCVETGCNTTAECTSSLKVQNVVCE